MKSFSKGKESRQGVMVHRDSSAGPACHLLLKSVIRYHFYLPFPFSGLFHTFTFVKVYWLCFLLCKSVENLMNQKQQWNKGDFLFISTGLISPLGPRAPGLLRVTGEKGERGEGGGRGPVAVFQAEAGPPQACGLLADQHWGAWGSCPDWTFKGWRGWLCLVSLSLPCCRPPASSSKISGSGGPSGQGRVDMDICIPQTYKRVECLPRPSRGHS